MRSLKPEQLLHGTEKAQMIDENNYNCVKLLKLIITHTMRKTLVKLDVTIIRNDSYMVYE